MDRVATNAEDEKIVINADKQNKVFENPAFN